jgi:hypothetical protein
MALISALPFFGCTVPLHRPSPVTIKPTDSYAVAAHQSGLAAAAESFDAGAKAEILGSEKLLREFTPILLVVENRAIEKLHFHRSNTKLICADGKTLDAVDALAMYEQLRDTPSTINAPAFAGKNWYIDVLDNNDRKRTDWMVKEFPAETILTMNRRAAGFLYFRGTCGVRTGRRLQLTADKLTSPDAIQLVLDLN